MRRGFCFRYLAVIAFILTAGCTQSAIPTSATDTLQVTTTSGPLSTPFSGFWQNVDSQTRGITSIVIRSEAYGLTVHPWDSCQPIDCDWGIALVPPADISADLLRVTWTPGFTVRTLVLTLAGGRLQVEGHTHFTDNSGRPDYDSLDVFTAGAPVLGMGNWSGTFSRCVDRWTCRFAFTLKDSGNALTGYWMAEKYDPEIRGPIAGRIEGSTVTMVLGQELASNCSYAITASVDTLSMTGGYVTTSCPSFPTFEGSFEARR